VDLLVGCGAQLYLKSTFIPTNYRLFVGHTKRRRADGMTGQMTGQHGHCRAVIRVTGGVPSSASSC